MLGNETLKPGVGQSAITDLKTLFRDRSISPIFIKSLILFAVSVNIFYLSVFKASQLQGNRFLVLVIFGTFYGSGVVTSGLVLKVM